MSSNNDELCYAIVFSKGSIMKKIKFPNNKKYMVKRKVDVDS